MISKSVLLRDIEQRETIPLRKQLLFISLGFCE